MAMATLLTKTGFVLAAELDSITLAVRISMKTQRMDGSLDQESLLHPQ